MMMELMLKIMMVIKISMVDYHDSSGDNHDDDDGNNDDDGNDDDNQQECYLIPADS